MNEMNEWCGVRSTETHQFRENLILRIPSLRIHIVLYMSSYKD